MIGAGAIGGPIAAHLVENNIETVLVTKHLKLAQLVKERGIRLQGVEETRNVIINAIPSIENLEGQFDIVFLATKANDVESVSKSILPYLKNDSCVVTLQNGIVEDAVAAVVGSSRVIGSIVVWASTMSEPGVIEKTAHGVTFLGLIDEMGNEQRLEQAAKLLEYCEPVRITDNIYGALYSKLVINACINGLSAVSGFCLGDLVSDERTRTLFMGIATEVCEVAEKANVKLETIGDIKVTAFAKTVSDTEEIISKKLEGIRMFGAKYPEVKPSALQSLERGRPSEIDYLNGYIVRKGKEVGVKTPINSAIVQIVKEIEQGTRKIAPANLLDVPIP